LLICFSAPNSQAIKAQHIDLAEVFVKYSVIFSVFLSLFVQIFCPVFAMDSEAELVTENTEQQPISREEAISEVIELMEAQARAIEIGHKLALRVAKQYKYGESDKDEMENDLLIQEVRQWMHTAVGFGFDNGSSFDLRIDPLWISANLLKTSEWWLDIYVQLQSMVQFIKSDRNQDVLLSVALEQLKSSLSAGNIGVRRPQTEEEIKNYGKYPPIDVEGLVYSTWREIIKKLESIKGMPSPFPVPTEEDLTKAKNEYVSYRKQITDRLHGEGSKIKEATQFYWAYYAMNTKRNYDEYETALEKFQSPAARKKFVCKKLDFVFTSFEKLVNEVPELLKLKSNVASAEKSPEEKTIEKSTKQKKHGGKGKKKHAGKGKKKPPKKVKSKNKANKSKVVAQESDDDDDDNEEEEAIDQTENAAVGSESVSNSSNSSNTSYLSVSENPQKSISYKNALMLPVKTPFVQSTVKSKDVSSYTTTMSINDYIFLRNQSRRTKASYVFKNTEYSFPTLKDIDVEFLKKVKLITHANVEKSDKEKLAHLSNLASGIFRIHYKHKNENSLKTMDFELKNLYLSGGRYFYSKDLEFKNKNNIFNAFHDVLTEYERKKVREQINLPDHVSGRVAPTAKFMRGAIANKLIKKVSAGFWATNSLDSEAIMLLDLIEHLPAYLMQITNNWTTPIEIQGIALGVQSYHESCWRCRNLIQGFQWSLEGLINHIASAYPEKPMISFAPDFATVVIVSGQTKANSLDNLQAKESNEIVKLESNQDLKSKHKFVSVGKQN
jgi:hypothetical protein